MVSVSRELNLKSPTSRWWNDGFPKQTTNYLCSRLDDNKNYFLKSVLKQGGYVLKLKCLPSFNTTRWLRSEKNFSSLISSWEFLRNFYCFLRMKNRKFWIFHTSMNNFYILSLNFPKIFSSSFILRKWWMIEGTERCK